MEPYLNQYISSTLCVVIGRTAHNIDKNIVRITIEYLDSLCALALPLHYSTYYDEAKRIGGGLGLVGHRGKQGNVLPTGYCFDCGIRLSTFAESSTHFMECGMAFVYCTYSECTFFARRYIVRKHEQTQCTY